METTHSLLIPQPVEVSALMKKTWGQGNTAHGNPMLRLAIDQAKSSKVAHLFINWGTTLGGILIGKEMMKETMSREQLAGILGMQPSASSGQVWWLMHIGIVTTWQKRWANLWHAMWLVQLLSPISHRIDQWINLFITDQRHWFLFVMTLSPNLSCQPQDTSSVWGCMVLPFFGFLPFSMYALLLCFDLLILISF